MREVRATILENRAIADKIYSLTFHIEEEIPIDCGQFCMIGIAGHPLRRPIAICRAEGGRITVCYQVRGEGTRILAEDYKAGETLSVLLPLGNSFPVADGVRKIALVGGGVGIFPLISVLRKYAPEREVYSYMGFRNKAAMCMGYELERGKKLKVATDDGSVGMKGTAVQAFLSDLSENRPDVVFSCGPLPMLRALKKGMEGKDIPVYVSLEERMGCGIGACLVCVCDKKDGTHARVCKDGPIFDLKEIVL